MKFLRRKTALCVCGQTNYRAEKICNQSNILSDKPRVRTKSVHGVYILCGTNKNPANGKYIRSQGSFYYNVKMIKRGFLFSLRRGGCCRLCFHFVGAAICRPPKCEAFSLINPHIVRTLITYYFLLLTYYFKYLPPVESATPFSLTLPHNVRNIIAAKPRANSYLHASFTAFAASLYSSRIFLKAASQFSLKLFSSRDV